MHVRLYYSSTLHVVPFNLLILEAANEYEPEHFSKGTASTTGRHVRNYTAGRERRVSRNLSLQHIMASLCV